MTKLSLAKYLKQIQGTLSKTLITFRTWKERQVLEDYPKPTYTRTSKQDFIRSWYKQGCDEWKKLTPEQKAQYKEKASKLGLTAFNVFMSEWLKKARPSFKYMVTIDNTQLAQTLTDYQIKLNVVSDETFFNDFNNDHLYLEVYDSDKQTQIPFWVEQWDITNKKAVIWIKIPSIPASSKKDIYLKYNPQRTTYLSNKANVLDFYDDFDVDLSKWVQSTGIWNVSNGYLVSPSEDEIYNHPTLLTMKNVRVIAKVQQQQGKSSSSIGIIARWQSAGNYYFAEYVTAADAIQIMKEVNGDWLTIVSKSKPTDLNPHIIEFRVYETRLEYWLDGVLELTATDTQFQTAGQVGYRKGGSLYYFISDYIYVMKYAYPEPTVTYTKL